jgi:hypothetical protein
VRVRATHPEAKVLQSARILPQRIQNRLATDVGDDASREIDDAQVLHVAEPSDEASEFQGAGVFELVSFSLQGASQNRKMESYRINGSNLRVKFED